MLIRLNASSPNCCSCLRQTEHQKVAYILAPICWRCVAKATVGETEEGPVEGVVGWDGAEAGGRLVEEAGGWDATEVEGGEIGEAIGFEPTTACCLA